MYPIFSWFRPKDELPKGPIIRLEDIAEEYQAAELEELLRLEVPQGTMLSYEFVSHDSVGYLGRYEISDETILKLIKTESEYVHPEKLRKEADGADKALCKYIFLAEQKGSCDLIVANPFRGKDQNKISISITVTEIA